MKRHLSRHGFSIIELLVSIVIVSALAALTASVVGPLREHARMVQAHSDLRQITVALELYRIDHDGKYPPTRASCSRQTGYQLPVELLEYGLPRSRDAYGDDQTSLADPFHPDSGYYYRAVGPLILNESTIVENGSTMWVPDGFPRQLNGTGRYHKDPRTSPARYAVWTMGPEPEAEKFDIPGRLPVPEKYWMKGAGDDGVIAHIMDRNGMIVISQ
jgi:prepilin-type N-terminal cleavage/methylation domain-containing protein